MKFHGFPFLFLLVTIRGISGSRFEGLSRGVLSLKLEQSPIGIGVKSAFTKKSRRSSEGRQQSRTIQACRQHESGYTRCAAVIREDVEGLGVVEHPHLRETMPKTYQDVDNLEQGGGDTEACPAMANPKVSRYASLTSEGGQVPVTATQSLVSTQTTASSNDTRGGEAKVRPLVFWENMLCGAVSRTLAQTIMHPANTMKTILQSSRGADRPTLVQLMRPDQFRMLTRGAGANFLLSVPHGAVNFAVLEFVRGRLNQAVENVPFLRERVESIGPALDFTSSAISTICCSVVSTPQMMITDNIMAGNYPNLLAAVSGLYKNGGVLGFYGGWFPGLVGKIPSYALTWTFFQQIKRVRDKISDRPAKNIENTVMGCAASAAAVCIMIPMDTIKTRLVTQMSAKAIVGIPYKGIIDCALRVAKEEGIRTFYSGLPPRLISVVPMIGIQFGVYEAMKKAMLYRSLTPVAREHEVALRVDMYGPEQSLKEAAMEVAASSVQPLPAPHFLKKVHQQKKRRNWLGDANETK